MTPEQPAGSFDYLNNLTIQQLKEILRSELKAEEVNVELIKKINAVLALKTEKREIAVDSAFERLMNASNNSELLYSEVLDDMEVEERGQNQHNVRIHYLLRAGIVAAILVSLFMCTSIVAYAMGFNVWGAVATWTEDHFGFSSNGREALYNGTQTEDPYAELREVLNSQGVTANVIPNYIPSGYTVIEVAYSESVEGPDTICRLTNRGQDVVLNYIVLQVEPSRSYTKDAGNPEVYISNGIEHYIYSNENYYRATWLNNNVECDFSGFMEKNELLKIIDSIYEE